MLDTFADYVGWCWTNIFIVKNAGWKFKSIQTLIQHFFSFFFMLDVAGCDFARIQYAGHHFRKMSIYIVFECLNIPMPIRIYCSCGQLFLSFFQNGFAKWRDSRTNNGNYQKWHKEIDRWWSLILDWSAWRETLFVGYFFRTSTKIETMQNWWNILIPLQLL